MSWNRIDLSGQTFGRLVVIGATNKRQNGQVVWACACSCGNTAEVRGSELRRGITRSCGCFARENMSRVKRTHGHTRPMSERSTPTYNSWKAMKARCSNPKATSYPYYGARGIRVCDRWQSFESFLEDMGPRPSPQHALSRIDNDQDYKPGNVRWERKSENSKDSRSRYWANRRLAA